MDNDFREFIDELLSRTDLVRLISRYLPLNKKGNTHWGCCPFHHEKDPSFAVNEVKQFYHCFGCKESGNAITFVEKMESVDFMDAVRLLAEDAKMEIPSFKNYSRAGDKAEQEKKKRLSELMREAARHYHENLSLPQAETAREYLQRRGVSRSLITKFGLGYSLNGSECIAYLESRGYTKAEMKEAGLIEQRADSYYDVFYGRLIFPIINNMGGVVAFGGRTLKADYEFAKYRNSSQTLIFDKSRNIYGINLLKKKKQSSAVDYVVMVEGYMDVIALHGAGFDTAVASMGTALTQYQAKMLKNYSGRVYISYDGDSAGQKATLRGLDILADTGLSVRVVSLPEGKDPDDVIKSGGAESYKKLLSEAVTLPAFKINTLKKEYDLDDPEGKSKFAVAAMKVINRLENPVEQEEYINLVHSYTGYGKDTLKKQAELGTGEQTPAPQSAESKKPAADDRETKAREFVLVSLINERPYADFSDDLSALLSDELSREIYCSVIGDVRDCGKVRLDSLFTKLSDPAAERLKSLMDYRFVEGDGQEKYRDCLKLLKSNMINRQMSELNRKLETAGGAEKISILKELDTLTKRQKEIETE